MFKQEPLNLYPCAVRVNNCRMYLQHLVMCVDMPRLLLKQPTCKCDVHRRCPFSVSASHLSRPTKASPALVLDCQQPGMIPLVPTWFFPHTIIHVQCDVISSNKPTWRVYLEASQQQSNVQTPSFTPWNQSCHAACGSSPWLQWKSYVVLEGRGEYRTRKQV